MRKAQLLISFTFIALFGAGAVSALLATRLAGDGPRHGGPMGPGAGGPSGGRDPESFLRRELGLTSEQNDKLKEIWSGTREQMQAFGRDKRRELARQRDQEVRELLTPEQRDRFDQIQMRYDKQVDDLRQAVETSMRQAEQKTREILTAEQRLKYEEMLKQRPHWGGDDRRRGPSTRPAGGGGEGEGPVPRGPEKGLDK